MSSRVRHTGRNSFRENNGNGSVRCGEPAGMLPRIRVDPAGESLQIPAQLRLPGIGRSLFPFGSLFEKHPRDVRASTPRQGSKFISAISAIFTNPEGYILYNTSFSFIRLAGTDQGTFYISWGA